MSAAFATPKKSFETKNRKAMPIVKILMISMALAAMLAFCGLYMAIVDAHQQQDQQDKRAKSVEFHNLHQKRKKTEAEWLRFCQLALDLGKGGYSACEVMQYMEGNQITPLIIKGKKIDFDFESLRHIVDRHTPRYPNSRPNNKGGGRTTFPKGTSLDAIVALMRQVVKQINVSNYSFEDSYSWKGWKKEVFYVWVHGKAYVLVVDNAMVSTFYPCRESEVKKRQNQFVNERE